MGKSKYVDTTAVVNVIGCIYIDPSLLENEEYHFNEEDFSDNDFHKVLFGTMYNLYQAGVTTITKNAIEDYLEQRPKLNALYVSNKGNEYLDALKENIQIETFKYHYDRMKKFTLLRMYNELAGMNLNWFYNPDNIMDVKLKQQQEDRLDNLSLIEIADLIDKQISDIKSTYVDNKDNGLVHAGEGAGALIEKFKEKPDIGYPLYGKFINTIFRGARFTKYYLRSAATGVGKAIPNYTKIPTPEGWKTVGDIRPGDYLFGANGAPTKVLKIHPQSEQKQIWKVKFTSGRELECCSEHLWGYYRYNGHDSDYHYTVSSTAEIAEDIKKTGVVNGVHRGNYFLVPSLLPAQYVEKQLPIDPYILGLLISAAEWQMDGRLCLYAHQNEIMIQRICAAYNWTYELKKNTKSFYFIKDSNGEYLQLNKVLGYYSDCVVLNKNERQLPKDYLDSSIDQRMALVQGLFDGGSTFVNTRVVKTYLPEILFTYLKNEQFEKDINNLVLSLGYITLPRRNKGMYGDKYKTFSVKNTNLNKIELFRFSKKRDQLEKQYNEHIKGKTFSKDEKAYAWDGIVSITPTDNYADMTCFTVDAHDSLFCVGDWIVTHNTRYMIGDACYIGCGSMYDLTTKKWINIGEPQPTLYIATEQEIEEIQTMMLAFISGVNEEHMSMNMYEDGEWERVQRAIAILEHSKIYFESLPDFSLADIESTIKRGIREHGVRYVFNSKRVKWDSEILFA